MFLRSVVNQAVDVNGRIIEFAEGEEIHTENSYKFEPQEFSSLASEAGFSTMSHWSDKRKWYSLFLLRSL